MEREELVGRISGGAVFSILIPELVASIIGFLVGLILFIFNLLFTISSINYVETTAKIVDVYYDSEMDTYKPVYEFEHNGEIVRANGAGWSDKKYVQVGSDVTINYNPEKYNQVNEGAKKDLILQWGICLFFLVCSGGSLVGFFKILKKFKQHKFNLYSMAEEARVLQENTPTIENTSNNGAIWRVLAVIIILLIITVSFLNIYLKR